MADYPLTQLGPIEFEHMVQSLLVVSLGSFEVKVYGMGRDGGRELTSRATLNVGNATWSGYTVAQVKFHSRPREVDANARWLRAEIRRELDAWVDPKRRRQPKPDNLLFVTNVPVSSVPRHGLDRVETIFAEYADRLQLKEFAVWHYDHLCRMLDSYPGVRAAYAGLITSGDVLTELHRLLVGEAVDLGRTMRRHTVQELVAEQWVKLGNAGSTGNEKLKLGEVGVDLTAARTSPNDASYRKTSVDTVRAIRHVLQVGDKVLRPTVRDGRSPHLVLVGGPGQGKTTVGQLICQIYRASLITDMTGLGQAAEVVCALRGNLVDGGLPSPRMKRWPLRLELSRYAEILGGSPDTSLLRFIAGRMTDRGTEPVTPAHLRTWLRDWPWLLVLDGFDEVVTSQVREAMIDRVSDFLVDAAEVDADLLVIATTRPQGYSAEFTRDVYEHLYLMPLRPSQAVAFAQKLADVRLHNDPDAHSNVLDRIGEAAKDPLTARLMQTPLQVTIMSLLLEGRSRVPQDRYSLFDTYYETIYSREIAKPTSISRQLEQHRRTVDELHARVGLQLQIQAEAGGNAAAAIPKEAFEQLARQLLEEQEFPPGEASTLATDIANAATRRLVLLVPKNKDDIGFDVRSLQELMAARGITIGDDDQILTRLLHLAASSHWRNTWLLATGRLAAQRTHLIEKVIALLDRLNSEDYLSLYLKPGATVALDLLDDRFAAPSPKVERLLLGKAIEVLHRPPSLGVDRAADALQRISTEGTSTMAASLIAEAARSALAAGPPAQITAVLAMQRWMRFTGSLAVFGRQRLGHDIAGLLGRDHALALESHFTASAAARPARLAETQGTLAAYLPHDTSSLTREDATAYTALRRALKRYKVRHHGDTAVASIAEPPRVNETVVEAALSRQRVADYFAEQILKLEPHQWAIASALSELIRQWHEQRPVSRHVL